jgi:tetratricopeptide (TPR) repeat protein
MSSVEVEQAVALARQRLQQGDLAGAERVLAPLFSHGLAGDPAVLQLAGLVRLQQGHFVQAEAIFAQARILEPRDGTLAYHHGAALAGLKRDATEAWRTAITLKPDLVEARLALNAVLIESGQMPEAETVARGGLDLAMEPRLKGVLHNNLGLALRAQNEHGRALEHFEKAQALNPAIPMLDMLRADLLQALKRPDDAAIVFDKAITADPANPRLHRAYNELLYRLDRGGEALRS